jgi:protocatechuate 3,4-dioxygenase beta subunit
MDNDDRLVGKVLSRREALKVLGVTGAAAIVVSCAPQATEEAPTAGSPTATGIPTATQRPVSLPVCVVRPEMTEGPYFVDERLLRSDIRSDPSTGAVRGGAPLEMTMNVSQVANGGCTVLEGATVDLWHCDAQGVYSDVADPRFNTVGQQFLRGYQVTDANGQVKFTTIYPGWYQGRTVHIHFKIRSGNQEFTSQMFFDDAFTDQVYLQEPYASKGERTVRNDADGIYQNGGVQLVLPVTQVGNGYAGTFDIGLQMG